MTRTRPLLFERYPALSDALPWLPLASLPTAVEPIAAPEVRRWLGRDDLWMKRDDRSSPICGGNKVRRFEFVLADALRSQAKRIITVGGLASTQVMATSLFGRELGLPVTAVLFDQPHSAFMREALLINAAAGTELIYGGGYVTTAWRTLRALWRQQGAYFIPPGAANPLANLGYVDAMFELAQQVERGEMPRPDYIVLPTGSSGTLAAMAIGAALLGWPTEIVGVRITLKIATNRLSIGAIIRATWRYLQQRAGALHALSPLRFRLLHGALGRGYGYSTPESDEALPLVAALTAMSGEATYSAKGLVGLRALAREDATRGKTILYWHTLASNRPPVDPGAVAALPASLQAIYGASLATP